MSQGWGHFQNQWNLSAFAILDLNFIVLGGLQN
jgi:hypothetical protein